MKSFVIKLLLIVIVFIPLLFYIFFILVNNFIVYCNIASIKIPQGDLTCYMLVNMDKAKNSWRPWSMLYKDWICDNILKKEYNKKNV